MDRKINYLPVSEVLGPNVRRPLKQGSLKNPSVQSSNNPNGSGKSQKEASPLPASSQSPMTTKPKVVCHSPYVVHNTINMESFRNSKKPQKVIVDLPPTLVITSEVSKMESSASSSDSGLHHTMYHLNDNDLITAMENSSTARPVFGDCCLDGMQGVKPLCMDEEQHPVPLKPSLEASHLIKEVGTGNNNVVVEEPHKRKKTSSKSVASRYMSSQGQSKQLSKLNTTKHLQKEIPSTRYARTASSKTKAVKKSAIPKPAFLDASDTSKVKEQKTSQPSGKTSTPNAGFRTFFESDMSTIQPNATIKEKKVKSHASNKHDKVTQSDLSLAYSDYVRLAYIRLAMQRSADVRHKAALSDITKLTNFNLNLQKEVADLEDEVKFLENEKQIHKMLDSQINMLGPVTNKLPSVQTNYVEMAENIDTTRHGLSIEDAVVPSEEHLNLTLQQTRKVLGDITTLTHTHAKSCANATTGVVALEQFLESEKDSLKVVEEETKKLAKLSRKEASLSLQLQTEKMFSENQVS